MAHITVNPVTLIAGTLGAPIVGSALGRMFITPKKGIGTEAEADAEFRRLTRNFALYNGVLALGLGYAASRKDLSEGWRSATLGGAIGTGLVAALLGASLVAGPAVDEPKAAPQIGPGTGALRSPTWSSTFLGYSR